MIGTCECKLTSKTLAINKAIGVSLTRHVLLLDEQAVLIEAT